MKPCSCCGKTLPLEAFYAHPMMADGHLNKCKECVRAYMRKRNAEIMADPARAPLEMERHRRKAKRQYREKRAAGTWQRSEAATTYRIRYPERGAAHVAVNRAVREGRLVKPDACEDCGRALPLHGHHDDYSRPLDVRWLCVDCHFLRHRKAA